MSISTEQTNSRSFTRHDLKSLLPEMVKRVHSTEFSKQEEIAEAYGVDPATTTRWKYRALELGLTDQRTWTRCLLLGRVTRLAT